jgi:tRNA-dihydrouridine synthase C
MAAEGGANWITIHARTRSAGYAPPVYWPRIGRVRARLGIPVVANGDIWSIECFRRCREETGCRHFMLGRGALVDPLLAHRVAQELGLSVCAVKPDVLDSSNWLPRLERFIAWRRTFHEHDRERSLPRLKQWLNLAAKHGGFQGFESLKRAGSVEELFAKLRSLREAAA